MSVCRGGMRGPGVHCACVKKKLCFVLCCRCTCEVGTGGVRLLPWCVGFQTSLLALDSCLCLVTSPPEQLLTRICICITILIMIIIRSFSVLCFGRSKHHVEVLEAVRILSRKPDLCAKKYILAATLRLFRTFSGW